jgi:hypothetical protein
MTTKNSSDRPPVLRFLIFLLALILVALGLAALSSSPDEATTGGAPVQPVATPKIERASASATSMPSTPADMIPPA